MMYIGIDYSINSPGICVESMPGFFNFFTVQKKGSKHCTNLNELNDVQIITLDKKNMTDFEFIDKQTDVILDVIQRLMEVHKDSNLQIAMEDYIYYSRQNSLIDIVAATTILRYKLIKKYGESVLFKYSPTSVKKTFTGSGKATKEDMLDKYKELGLHNPFAEYCMMLDKTAKPEEDFVDAFAVLYTHKNIKTADNNETF